MHADRWAEGAGIGRLSTHAAHRGRFSSGKPTIRPVLKRNVAAVTRPFVLQRVGGRRTAGYNILSRSEERTEQVERKESVWCVKDGN